MPSSLERAWYVVTGPDVDDVIGPFATEGEALAAAWASVAPGQTRPKVERRLTPEDRSMINRELTSALNAYQELKSTTRSTTVEFKKLESALKDVARALTVKHGDGRDGLD